MIPFEVLVRFLHFVASLLLLGSFSFTLLVARPAAKKASEARSCFLTLSRTQLLIARWALLLAIVSAFVALAIKIDTATGQSWSAFHHTDALTAVLTGTRFGIVWMARMLIAGLLAVMLLLYLRGSVRADSLILSITGMIFSGLFLVALAFTGHAAAAEGVTFVVQVLADALHLLAAGVWLGGLLPLILLFYWIRKTNEPATLLIAQDATRRFSLIGIVSVVVLVLTGSFNASYLLNGFAPLFGTTYGWLLLAKLALLIPLIGLAAVNLLRLKPRLLSFSSFDQTTKVSEVLSRLQQSVVAELGVGAIVLLLVGAMGITPPARHIQPEWPFSFRFNWDINPTTPPAIPAQVNTGGAIALVGMLSFLVAFFRRGQRGWMIGAGVIIVGVGTIIAAAAVSIDAYPTTYRRPSVPYQAISIVNGKSLYRENCTVCHGDAGYGDGPAAEDLNPKPANLTARHATDHTAGDLYWWLSYGIKETAMPGYENSLTEEERWDLINFVRALSSGRRARLLASIVETEASLVAPDFSYETNREAKTLKDHRGSRIVLLVFFTLPQSQERLEQLDDAQVQLTAAGVEIILVPSDGEEANMKIGTVSQVVTEGGREIFETYSLFGTSFAYDPSSLDASRPHHTEFLIDKQGYIRARWIAREGPGWSKIENLLQQVETLRNEKSQSPAPDDHVH